MVKVLLVTLAIGDKYLQIYNALFRESQEAYAKRCGYDFKVITDFISGHSAVPTRHASLISFNKILVCSQDFSKDYDYIVFVDADIIISKHAPPIHTSYIWSDKIGIVNEYSQPTPELRIQLQKKNGWEASASEYYNLVGLDINTRMVLNSGVLVMQPEKHAQILLDIYNKYANSAINNARGFHYEQSCIGYELMKNDMYYIMPNKWNVVWALYRDVAWYPKGLLDAYYDNYFIHFAGKADYRLIPALLNIVTQS